MKKNEERLQLNLTAETFKRLVRKLEDLIKSEDKEEVLVPWEKAEEAAMRETIQAAAAHLPLIYQKRYVQPLLDNLHSVVVRSAEEKRSGEGTADTNQRFNRNLEILAGAVYCHAESKTISKPVVKALHGFLAVVSNSFHSFLSSSPRHDSWVPHPQKDQYPPLATFRNGEIAPYMLTSDVVEKATGGTIGVVVLPAHHKDHPLLWTAIAHEVGGHEMLNAMPQLLGELQKGIRHLFFNARPVQSEADLDTDKLVGLLWQYWAEETVADVCGVLNLGPSYGVSLALYQAVLYKAMAEEQEGKPDTLLRMWSTIPPRMAERGLDNTKLWDLDPHPVDILKLHVIIGAVENLTMLEKTRREHYVDQLEKIARACAGGKREIKICGLLQAGPDLWIPVNTYTLKDKKPQHLDLELMQKAARRVGAYIAQCELNALNGRSLQKIATWDEADEDQAEIIAKTLTNARRGTEPDVTGNTDDAQLLAGATLAFALDPYGYANQRKALMEALEASYIRDYYWGVSMLHRFWSYPVKDRTEDRDLLTGEEPDSKAEDSIAFPVIILGGEQSDNKSEDPTVLFKRANDDFFLADEPPKIEDDW